MKYVMQMSSLAVAIAIGVATQAVAAGQDGHHRPHHSFEELDANSDGKITAEEMATHMQARFEGADADGNGALSRDELLTRMQERQAERAEKYIDHMLERHDANGDGSLSFEEMRDGRSGKMFARLDTDADGAISVEEFDAMKAGHGHKKHGHGEDEAAE